MLSSFCTYIVCIRCSLNISVLACFTANLLSRVKKGRMTQQKFEKTFSLLKGVLDYDSFKDVDLVIEVLGI